MEIRLKTGLKRDGQRYSAGAILDLPESEVLDLIRHGAAEHVLTVEATPTDATALEREQLLAGYKKTNAELTADNQALRKELERARARKQSGADAAEVRELKAKVAQQEEELEEADRTFTQLRTQNDELSAEVETLRNQIQTMQTKAIGTQEQTSQTAPSGKSADSGKDSKSNAK